MNQPNKQSILLASASSRRADLLRQINVVPEKIIAADIDEKPLRGETPRALAIRLSQQKAQAIYSQEKNYFILAADTVVSSGKKFLEKPIDRNQARDFLYQLQGKRHQVHGGITIMTPEGRCISRHCVTMVQFAPLSERIIEDYIALGEWEGKAGGYAIQGFAGSFVKRIDGSYSNVVGLSLYDTVKLMQSAGIKNI